MALTDTDRPAAHPVLTLLGPFDARLGDQPLPLLRFRKAERLLALLALHPDRSLERVWLADTLWPDSGENLARFYLRRCLSDLRRALGPAADRLRSASPHCLSLDLASAVCDLHAFDAAITRGDTASLEQAVALYRGPLLEGWSEEWIFPERRPREEAYLTALERLAAAATTRREYGKAARWLQRVVSADPYRESAQRHLMQALSDSGDPAAAVHVYRELQILLHRDLNAAPAPETAALFHALRAAAAGRARERESERAREVLNTASSPRALHRSLPRSVPRPLTGLVGREREVTAIQACLATARLVTLTGPGGVGKTRLAIEVASQLQDVSAEGACFVDLAALTDPMLVAHHVAAALQMREEPGRPLIEALQAFLSPRRLLLVLDNCEHLVDACARLVETLLQGCPDLHVLATGRQALDITGEMAWRVPSLIEDEAIRLFVERAAAARPGFTLSERNAETVAQICRRLDGLPLAIDLAATRVRALTIEELAARLEEGFSLLIGGSRTALPRQQTLRATLDWSYGLLSPPERMLLRRLAVFAGGWTLEAAEAVCSGVQVVRCSGLQEGLEATPEHLTTRTPEHLNTQEVLDLLSELVDQSLVWVVEHGGTTRYRLPETTREYARELLFASGEAEEARRRHASFFLGFLERARHGLYASDAAEWLGRVEREHDNLRAAWEWSRAEESRTETGLRLAARLGRFWMMRGSLSEGRRWLEESLGRSSRVSPRVRAEALRLCGFLAHLQGDYEPAARFVEESLQLYRELGNRSGICGALKSLGDLRRMQDDYPSAVRFYEESRAVAHEEGLEEYLAASLNGLGGIAAAQGRYPEAAALLEESLRLNRALDYRRDSAALLAELGSLAMLQGDWGRASPLLEECLALSREVADRRLIAHADGCLGHVACRQGSHERAAGLLQESLTLHVELGQKAGIAAALRGLGDLALEQDDGADGWAFYARCLAIRAELRDQGGIAECLEGLARVACARREPERVARLLGAAEVLRAAIGAPVPPADRAAYDCSVAAARAVLGEAGFAAAGGAGRALTLAEAVAYALEMSG